MRTAQCYELDRQSPPPLASAHGTHRMMRMTLRWLSRTFNSQSDGCLQPSPTVHPAFTHNSDKDLLHSFGQPVWLDCYGSLPGERPSPPFLRPLSPAQMAPSHTLNQVFICTREGCPFVRNLEFLLFVSSTNDCCLSPILQPIIRSRN